MPPRGLLLQSLPSRRPRARSARSAFDLGPDRRSLYVLVDDRAAASGDAFEFLIGLCGRPEINAVREVTGVPNRLTFEAPDREADLLPFTITSAQHSTYSGIWPYAQWEARMRALIPSLDGTPCLPEGIRLAGVAEEVGADALATADPLLLEHRHDPMLARSNIRSVAETIALVGLFLRSRGDYTVWPEYGLTYGRGGYYFGLARELLPAAWRWFSACVAAHHQGGLPRVQGLGEAAMRRVQRALRCRDAVYIEVAKLESRDAADEALFYLDSLLVALGGAFDAVARTAHLTYGLPSKKFRSASWRRPWWRADLAGADPRLAERMAPHTDSADALALIAALRNCLHGEALGTMTVAHSGGQGRTLVTVPADEAGEVRAVLDRHPQASSFGIEDRDGRLRLRPEILCEALVPWAVETLDGLMAATDVTRLPGVSPGGLMAGPPSEENRILPGTGLFDPHTRQRLLLLAGL
jgi:hypothetical protein